MPVDSFDSVAVRRGGDDPGARLAHAHADAITLPPFSRHHGRG
jgi:hypothetical protein